MMINATPGIDSSKEPIRESRPWITAQLDLKTFIPKILRSDSMG